MRYLPDSVRDTNGNALSGVTVTYKRKGTATTIATFTTDTNGQYDWSTLKDGDYDVTFSGGLLSSTQTGEISIKKNNVTSQTVSAVDTITASYTMVLLTGQSGAVTLTSTPSITNGESAQSITLVGASDTNTVTIQDSNTLASSGLKLKNGQNFTFGAGDTMILSWDSVNSVWREDSRSDNLN